MATNEKAGLTRDRSRGNPAFSLVPETRGFPAPPRDGCGFFSFSSGT
jgi:hypothetical protein